MKSPCEKMGSDWRKNLKQKTEFISGSWSACSNGSSGWSRICHALENI